MPFEPLAKLVDEFSQAFEEAVGRDRHCENILDSDRRLLIHERPHERAMFHPNRHNERRRQLVVRERDATEHRGEVEGIETLSERDLIVGMAKEIEVERGIGLIPDEVIPERIDELSE